MNLKKIYKRFSFKNYDSGAAGLIALSPDQIRMLQKVMLGICDDVFTLCKEKGYVCFLGGGSALGAIRHQGFIPWDDDVDLCITRESYEKFIPEFRAHYGDKYWIHTPEDNPEYGVGIGRVRKKGTKLKERMDLFDDSEAGIAIDLFIVENVFDNEILRALQGFLCMAVKICLSCRLFYRDRRVWIEATEYSKDLMKRARFRLVVGFLCSFMSVERWTKLESSVFSMCRNDQSEFVTIPQGSGHFFGELCRRDEFCATRLAPFEGRDYPVCKGIDDYMRRLYGDDYMVVPPPEKREAHLWWEVDFGDADTAKTD